VSAPAVETATLELTYTGRARVSDAKIGAAFLVDGQRFVFGQTRTNRQYRVGAVYALEVTRGPGTMSASFAPGADAFVRMHDDPGQVAAWRLADQAVEVVARRAKLHAKAGGLTETLAALEPIRDVYRATDYTGRRAIEMLVLEYLRRYT
jgi:hypothetical protein